MENKKIFKAVAVIMMTLCGFVGCAPDDDLYGNGFSMKLHVNELSCVVNANEYGYSGVITRAASYTGTPDGEFTATSRHEKSFYWNDDVTDKFSRLYTGVNHVKAYDVLRPRYARSADIFKNPVIGSPITLDDGRLSYPISFQNGSKDFTFALVENQEYDSDTLMVEGQEFEKCKNNFTKRELVDAQVTYLNRDSTDWQLHSALLTFQYTLAEGPDNVGTFKVRIPNLWIVKPGTDPDDPEDKPEIVSFKQGDMGFDYVNDTLSNTWFDLIAIDTYGKEHLNRRISTLVKNKLYEPEYQIKIVPNLDWKEGTATPSPAVKEGEEYRKENNIFATTYVQTFTTRTDKADAIFRGTYEGNIYFVDSLGKSHMFLQKDWSFKEAEKAWQESSMDPTDAFNRKLLTTNIVGTFNAHDHNGKGEVELRASKDGDVTVVRYDYKNFGIEPIIKGKEYYTFADQFAVLSNGKTDSIGRIGTKIYVSTVAPERQYKDVIDWNINDLNAVPGTPIEKTGREDKQTSGTFSIGKFDRSFTTQTNRSECVFVTTYEDKVIFTDKFGKQVTFLGLSVTFADQGGVKTLTDLLEQDNKERKEMTSTITVTVNNADNADSSAEVEFRKEKAQDAKIIGYLYQDFAIRTVTPNSQYFTYCTRIAQYSDGTTKNLGSFGTNIYVSVTKPNKQTITVTDWNISDLSAVKGTAVKKGDPRKDEVTEGVFNIQKFDQIYTTKTNKSECIFTVHYEDNVVFTDKFGKEVTFKGLSVAYKDKGGTSTLSQIVTTETYESKTMTSTMNLTVNGSDNADYSAELEFRKAVEKEQLISWSKTLSLTPAGNGMWTTSATITKVWKLAGSKTNTVSQLLDCSISGETKKKVKLSEASAPYVTINQGSWSAETSSTPQQYVTLYTKTNTTISENYTNLTDKYVAKLQRATYKEVVDGQTIEFDFLAPTEMTIAHKDGNLTDGNRTVTEGNTIYDVWDHSGSVTATVTSASGNQTQDAFVEKEVLVAHVVVPADPELGKVIGLASANGHKAASLTLRPNIGRDGKGEFYKTLVIQYENGIRVVTTASYGPSAYDFTTNEGDKYVYGHVYNGITFPRGAKINSSAYFDGKFLPALITEDGKGWKYVAFDGRYIECSQNLADTRDIKNFTGDKTAECNPWLYYEDQLVGETLYVKSMTGVTVYVTK